MKKNFILAAFATLTMLFIGVSEANAQKVTWNAKGGLGLSSCVYSGVGEGTYKQKFVGKIGVGAEIPFAANWSVMPSFEYAFKGTGWEYTYEEYTKVYTREQDVSLSYLQIPVVAAYRLNLSKDWNLTLKAGPYFALGIDGVADMDDYATQVGHERNDNVFETIQRFDCGIDVGVDFEYHRFVIGLEYERGLTTMSKVERGDFDIYTQAFYATIGYKF